MLESLFHDYSFIYDAPTSKRTGEVGIYINKSFDFIARTDVSFSNSDCETCFIKIKHKKRNLIVVVFTDIQITI